MKRRKPLTHAVELITLPSHFPTAVPGRAVVAGAPAMAQERPEFEVPHG